MNVIMENARSKVIEGYIVCGMCGESKKLEYISWMPKKFAYVHVCKDCAIFNRLGGNKTWKNQWILKDEKV